MRGEREKMLPLISQDEEGLTTMEWWVGDRKITMYPQDGLLLKVWGPNIVTDMEEVRVQDTVAVREAFEWLAHNGEVKAAPGLPGVEP